MSALDDGQWRAHVDRRLDNVERGQIAILASLADNTAVTNDVKGMMIAGKFMKWLFGIGASVAGIVGVVWAIFHGTGK